MGYVSDGGGDGDISVAVNDDDYDDCGVDVGGVSCVFRADACGEAGDDGKIVVR